MMKIWLENLQIILDGHHEEIHGLWYVTAESRELVIELGSRSDFHIEYDAATLRAELASSSTERRQLTWYS